MNNRQSHEKAATVISRNGEFDFFKFIASIFIALFHSYSFYGDKRIVAPGGVLAVEYFFLVTGFLFASSVYRDTRKFSSETIGEETCSFVLRKIRGFLPYFILGFALSLVMLTFSGKISFTRSPGRLLDVMVDLLLLRETGLPLTSVLGVDWYFSSMVIVLFILYPIFRFRKNLFSYWIAPIIGIGCIAYLFMKGGQINLGNGVSIGIMTAGTCRAFGDICLGVVAWRVAMWIKSLGCMSRGVCRHFLSIVGLTSMAMACAIMAFVEQPAHQHVALILFFCCVSITGSRTASVNSLYKPGLCGFLGKWSLSIFLTHSSLRWLLLALSRRMAWLAELMSARDTLSITALIAIYLSSSLVLGLVGMLICEPLQKRLSQCH